MKVDRVIALWVALATVVTASAQSTVETVSARRVGPGVEVSIAGKDLAKPRVVRANANRSYILEFDATMTARPKRENVRFGGLDYVQVVWFNARPPRIRVHLWLRNGQVEPILVEGKQGWTVQLNVPAPTKAAIAPTPAPAPVRPNPILATVATFVVTPPVTPKTRSADPLDQPFDPKPQPIRPTTRPAPPVPVTPVRPSEPLVTLDFVNTDVVQIFKALALQAGVNIVASPDVKGTLTISLSRMRLNEALDVVVALSNLRYAKVGRTFLVTTPERFNETLRQLGNTADETVETRVVPIFSGQGNQIKATILKTLPQADLLGRYDLMLPSEQISLEQKPVTGPALPGAATDPAAGATTVTTKSTEGSSVRDEYVVVVGSTARIPNVVKAIEGIDQQICRALGIEYASRSENVQLTYQVKGANAVDLLKALDVKDGKVGTVRVAATPANSESRQSIVLSGRSNEVNRIVSVLEELDDVARVEQDYFVYDVKFVDPRSLRQELINHVPGLRAIIPPASVGNPNLFDPRSTRAAFTETTQAGPTGQGGEGSPGSAGSARPVQIGNTRGVQSGLEQPFRDLENISVPMRLILRGTREQIATAVEYSKVVDVAPRQVALEMRVMELSREDALKVGLDWSLLTGGFVRTIRLNNTLGDTAASPGTVSGSFGNGNMSGDVLGTLDKMNDNRKVLARPNLLALDGRETEFFVGDTVRYIESIQTTQNGVTVTTGEVRVGVRLAVIARVGGDGQITLDMRPVTSLLNGFTPVPGGGNLPQTSERVAQSTAVVRSGETLALGGLIREEERKTTGGIPILKDLPIIGLLFSRQETKRDRTEIVFFITAREVTESDRQNAAVPLPTPIAKPAPKR